jgi:hypothetical protein
MKGVVWGLRMRPEVFWGGASWEEVPFAGPEGWAPPPQGGGGGGGGGAVYS